MESFLDILKRRNQVDWLLLESERDRFSDWFDLFSQNFSNLSENQPSAKILLAESDPIKFLASFSAAVALNCPVFLGNPNWGQQEWEQVFDLVEPDIIVGEISKLEQLKFDFLKNIKAVKNSHFLNLKDSFDPVERLAQFFNASIVSCTNNREVQPLESRIMIPTGGSSGKIRFAIHSWESLTASVLGFRQYFQVGEINSFCVLPLYHVSGLMQFIRAFVTGGKLVIYPFKTLEIQQNIPEIEPNQYFISFVPTQLQRLLNNPNISQWLTKFQAVLLGGAPAWSELLDQAETGKIPVALTYGMTETASQIVTLKPADFLAGHRSCGKVLPHATVRICNENGEILEPGKVGAIAIQAKSLTQGYYSQEYQFNPPFLETFQSDDLGYFNSQGYLHILGRNSDKIISGGENIFPAEVETVIRATQFVSDVCVLGVPDLQWGEVVTAIYVPIDGTVNEIALQKAIASQLTKFKQPKYWIPIPELPRNSQGKINRLKLQEIAQEVIQEKQGTGNTEA